jgi:LuxR family maltose regulon positive regulatory protein
LNEGLSRKLILLSAPAGFGKTTLLSEWIKQEKLKAAWVSLDEGDNDIIRFLSYCVAALQTVLPGIGDIMIPEQRLRTPDVDPILTTLINDLAEIQDPLILVLDDYHLINTRTIHEALTFLLDNLPPLVHLAIASRKNPPLPIARLRGRGQLVELRSTNLRFTAEEIQEFLRQSMKLQVPEDIVNSLLTHTEGWIAGLQMAAVSMKNRQDTDAFIKNFTGSHRYILDYLVEEVLQNQPETVQSFLLQTSILLQLNGPLCDAVTELNESQGLLERIEQSNLFIIPLDDQRSWYRYHRLFADLLRHKLRQTSPELVPLLHNRASQWFEESNMRDEAIEHALSGRDFKRAARLIEENTEQTLMRGELGTLLNWVDALPEENVCTRPVLCIYHAGALLLTGQPLELVEQRLHEVEQGEQAESLRGETAVFRAYLAALQGDVELSKKKSRQALKFLPKNRLFLRNLAVTNLGFVYLYTGEIEEAIRSYNEALSIAKNINNLMLTVEALYYLAELHVMKGRLREAEKLFNQGLDLSVDRRGHRLPLAGMVLNGLGNIQREYNDFEAAIPLLEEGIKLSHQWGEIHAFEGYIYLARIRQAQENWESAGKLIENAREIAVLFDASELDDRSVEIFQTRLWLAQGNVENAWQWVKDRELDRDFPDSGERLTESDYLGVWEYITLVRVLLAQNRDNEALEVIEPLLYGAEIQQHIGDQIELLVLQALAYNKNLEKALGSLEKALSLAKPGGYIRIFVDEGPVMAHLLYEASSRGIMPKYTGRLLAAFPIVQQKRTFENASIKLVEPLSKRELEVLRLLAQGLPNKEVAAQLFISLSTVKWHTSNLYAKLKANNRAQAIARGRALGLLPGT